MFEAYIISLHQTKWYMRSQANIDFERIKCAINFIDINYKQQPSLDEVAASVHLSSTHFHQLFKEWAGVSPKQFLQFITISHAKVLLKEGRESLLNSSVDLGLSSSSRLHDLFINIEAMTPGEYKNAGKGLVIDYTFADSRWGNVLIASSHKGICHLSFYEDEHLALNSLINEYSNATFQEKRKELHDEGLAAFSGRGVSNLSLHLRGTDFQLKVWEALLRIPFGQLVSYSDLATDIGQPTASRAVGTAIGNNPVAYLIPCHRVIQATGAFGGYKWDMLRKKTIIGWESAIQK